MFVDVSEKEQKTGNSRRLIEKKRIDKDMAQYTDWIKRGAELQHPTDTDSIDQCELMKGCVVNMGSKFTVISLAPPPILARPLYFGLGLPLQMDKELEFLDDEEMEEEGGRGRRRERERRSERKER